MIKISTLNNYFNGNFSELSKSDLIKIAKFFESGADYASVDYEGDGYNE